MGRGRRRCGAVDEFLERAGQGADAAFDAGRDELREEVEEEVGVVEAFARGPVGGEDLFLHASAVEAAIGKSVDGKNVAAVTIQPLLEGDQRLRLGELAGGLVAQAEADAERFARAHALADGEGVLLEAAESFPPVFTAMDVRAVGEMEAVVEFHRTQSGFPLPIGWGEGSRVRGRSAL